MILYNVIYFNGAWYAPIKETNDCTQEISYHWKCIHLLIISAWKRIPTYFTCWIEKEKPLTHTLIENKSLWSEYAMSLETWIKLAMGRPYKRSRSLPPCNIGKRLMKQAGLYNTSLDLLSIENSKLQCQIKPNEMQCTLMNKMQIWEDNACLRR